LRRHKIDDHVHSGQVNAAWPSPSLVAALTPAVKAVAGQPGNELENATRENVRLTVETLRSATPLLSAAVNDKRLKIAGGIYRLKDGAVELIA